jgi:hypothetical protein
LLITLKGYFHCILDVDILESAIGVDLVGSEEVRIVAGEIFVGDTPLEGVVEQVRLQLMFVLPAGLQLVLSLREMLLKVLPQVLLYLHPLLF